MLAPRCGVVDVKRKASRSGAVARWEKPVLKWSLEKPTSQLDAGRIRLAVTQALEVWSAVVPLKFVEVPAGSGADMQLGFGAYEHGDGFEFDGRGGVLAHAFFPSDGRLHFDDHEVWAFEDAAKVRQGYTDLLSVTIHELGHSLGLEHSNEEDAIMFPFYRAPEIGANGTLKQFQLSHFDIREIQAIYGPRDGANTRAPTTPGPSNCPRFDAAVTGFDGATYFFTQDSGWTKANVNSPATSATKFQISQTFPGAPSGITAAVTDPSSQMIYLFQGRTIFGYSWEESTKSFTLAEGFPMDLQDDVPFVPVAALRKDGHIFVFKGDDLMIWDPVSNAGSFKKLVKNYFPNLPVNSMASFAVGDDKLYFVNGGDEYAVYDLRSSKVVSTHPLKSLIMC